VADECFCFRQRVERTSASATLRYFGIVGTGESFATIALVRPPAQSAANRRGCRVKGGFAVRWGYVTTLPGCLRTSLLWIGIRRS
jgi:hypothetical protein